MVVMMEGEGGKLNTHQAGLPQAKNGHDLENKMFLSILTRSWGCNNSTSCSKVHSPIHAPPTRLQSSRGRGNMGVLTCAELAIYLFREIS